MRPYIPLFARSILCMIFVASVVGKARDVAGFRESLQLLGLAPKRHASALSGLVIAAECLVVVLCAINETARAGILLGVALLLVFTAVALRASRRGDHVPCSCFGASSTPLGAAHALRNLLIVGLVLPGLWPSSGEVTLAGLSVTVFAATGPAVLAVFFEDLSQLFGRPPSVLGPREERQ